MKRGLLVYSSINNIFNIGDYIQSLAASQFFKDKIDFFVKRENLSEYSGDKLKLIMNGWFMHEPKNWPPSSDIDPLFVSFHINSVAKKEMLSPDSIAYFMKWQPIGCRDKETTRLLQEKGVQAYFSGCLTLTLGESYKVNKRSDKIYFVDPYFEYNKNFISLLKYVFVLISKFRTLKKITNSILNGKNRRKNGMLVSILKTAAFYNDYSKIFESDLLENAIYINQEIQESDFISEKEKFAYAKELLEKYSASKLVVTSRIHCALPSLGMGTPVIYVENVNQPETSFCRLEGLRELFNIITYDKGEMKSIDMGLKNKIGTNYSVSNKTGHVLLKDNLINKCKTYVGTVV